jgi:hypothetical protein
MPPFAPSSDSPTFFGSQVVVGVKQESYPLITSMEAEVEVAACQVCQTHQARYTCPKCHLAYCSVACYRNHNYDNKSNNLDSSCTESFYQSRVNSILKLEQKEYAQHLRQTLRRLHDNNQAQQDHDDNTGDDGSDEDSRDHEDSEDADCVLSDTELLLLSKIVNKSDEDLDLDLLPRRIQVAFKNAIQNGKMDRYIVPWHPWWEPKYVAISNKNDSSNILVKRSNLITSRDNNKNDIPTCIDRQTEESQSPTLDERLLRIPSFSALTKSCKPPSPLLVFNLIDILYAVVRTLRLYNGIEDALLVGKEAATVLMQASSVLYQDARYGCIEQVLTKCTTDSTTALRCPGEKSTCNTPWTVLVEDVATILSNGRYVARALLEAIDLIKTTTTRDNKKNKHIQRHKTILGRRESGYEVSMLSTDASAKINLPFKPCLKKLEFYLSWSRQVLSAGEDSAIVVSEIRAWVIDWTHKKDEDHQQKVDYVTDHQLMKRS